MTTMERINLQPDYTCNEVPGRCLKCLAEKELDNCLFSLLSEQSSDEELQRRYEALLSLLESPDLERLRGEAERLLSEGKQVKVRIDYGEGDPRFELISE